MYCIVLQPQIFRWSHLLFPYWRFEYSVPSCQCVAPRVLIRYRYRQYYSTHWLRLQTPIYPVLILITICFQSIFWKSNLLWCQCGKWIFFSVKNQLKPFFVDILIGKSLLLKIIQLLYILRMTFFALAF